MDLSATEPATELQIGVVIPSYNRADALLRCMAALERQSLRAFEVVVVDDGSTDGTQALMQAYSARAPFRLQYLRQSNSGPARARNRGIAALRAPLCVMIGDDIFPKPDFLECHVALHSQHPEPQTAALGLTVWAEQGQVVTPFMRWLGYEGMQFAYRELLAGAPPTWRHFYTSNLSLKTGYLRQNPFCELFPNAAVEDIELGYRLAQQHGLQMYFLPQAVAEHLHPTSFPRTCRRMVDVGKSQYLMGQLWPEFCRRPPKSAWKRWLLWLLTEPRLVLPLLARTVDALLRIWCPNPLLMPVLQLHSLRGQAQAVAAAGRGDRNGIA